MPVARRSTRPEVDDVSVRMTPREKFWAGDENWLSSSTPSLHDADDFAGKTHSTARPGIRSTYIG